MTERRLLKRKAMLRRKLERWVSNRRQYQRLQRQLIRINRTLWKQFECQRFVAVISVTIDE